jgi:hypothetical protein
VPRTGTLTSCNLGALLVQTKSFSFSRKGSGAMSSGQSSKLRVERPPAVLKRRPVFDRSKTEPTKAVKWH